MKKRTDIMRYRQNWISVCDMPEVRIHYRYGYVIVYFWYRYSTENIWKPAQEVV